MVRAPGTPLSVVLVTGGSRGIGRATAAAFVARGDRVAVGDLDPVVGSEIPVFRLDCADRASFERFVAEATAALGPPDVLVNNAGIMPLGAFVDADLASARRTVDVNLWGVIVGMRAVLPGMVARGRGTVINVASMMGRVHVPGAAVYGATKAAVVALGDAVRDELAGTGVAISTVLPTLVHTELASGVPLGRGLPTVTAERVARAVVRCADRPRRRVYVPRWLAAVDPVLGATPEPVMRWIRALLAADRVLHSLDQGARRAYEQRAVG